MQDILIAIDLQNDFIDGALGSKEAVAIIPKAEKRIREFQGRVIFTRDTHFSSYMDTEEGRNLPVPHCIKGTKGWELHESIEALRTEDTIDKLTFGSSELGPMLARLNEEEPVGTVTLLGLDTDICVLSNAMIVKAFLPEAHVMVDSECSAGVTPESHSRALAAMEMCHIEILGNNR